MYTIKHVTGPADNRQRETVATRDTLDAAVALVESRRESAWGASVQVQHDFYEIFLTAVIQEARDREQTNDLRGSGT